jgi:hypothetical protein
MEKDITKDIGKESKDGKIVPFQNITSNASQCLEPGLVCLYFWRLLYLQ